MTTHSTTSTTDEASVNQKLLMARRSLYALAAASLFGGPVGFGCGILMAASGMAIHAYMNQKELTGPACLLSIGLIVSPMAVAGTGGSNDLAEKRFNAQNTARMAIAKGHNMATVSRSYTHTPYFRWKKEDRTVTVKLQSTGRTADGIFMVKESIDNAAPSERAFRVKDGRSVDVPVQKL